MLLTDVPYLEPLLFHLQDDETLKQYFTEKSFFMPHYDLVKAITEKTSDDCPLPNLLWILPGDTTAEQSAQISNQRRVGCKSTGKHSFVIALAVHCIRNTFVIKKVDGKAVLEGQFMELTRLRKLVKDSVHKFSVKHQASTIGAVGKRFENIVWTGDQNLYPEENDVLLATSINFEVTILP